MTRRIVPIATKVLSLLPIVHTLSGRVPSPKVIAATGLLSTPYVRRLAPGLSGLFSIGLAVIAVAGFVNDIRRRKGAPVGRRVR